MKIGDRIEVKAQEKTKSQNKKITGTVIAIYKYHALVQTDAGYKTSVKI